MPLNRLQEDKEWEEIDSQSSKTPTELILGEKVIGIIEEQPMQR